MIEECPSCGLKLEKGFLSGYKIKWTKQCKSPPPKIYLRSGVLGEGGLLRPLIGKSFLAYRCKNCNLVISKTSPMRFSQPSTRVSDLTPNFNVSYIKRKKLLSENSESD